MKKLLLGAASFVVLAGTGGPAYADFTLNILHFNDFHSRYDSINAYDSNCSAEDEAGGKCFGGMGRLMTAVDDTRAALAGAGENVVLLDAGDDFQGSLYFTTYGSEVVNEFNNALGIDVMELGNHEFDRGPEETAKFIAGAKYPVVSGNLNVSKEPLLAGKLKGVVILDIGGEKVGVVSGLAEDTAETSSPGDNIRFAKIEDNLMGAVKALEAAGINKIIALTHDGFKRDVEIAATVPGIDVIVGGHSHTVMSNTDESAEPYPTMVTGPAGNEVPVVTAGSYAKYLGDLKVTWDNEGNVISATGDTILLDASIAPDEAVNKRLAELSAPIEELKAKVIGVATAEIDGSRDTCRAMECAMGDLLSDAMLDRSADQGMNIAIQNGGGLRASIEAGDITMGDVLTVLPFSNTLATMQLKGADVVAALENGLSQVEEGAGRFPQVGGLRFTWTRDKPAGERVIKTEVMDNGAWVPIDPNKLYGVVTNNYMRAGGDGYSMFATDAVNPYDFGPPLEDVLADYIAKLGGEYTPRTGDRITEVQ